MYKGVTRQRNDDVYPHKSPQKSIYIDLSGTSSFVESGFPCHRDGILESSWRDFRWLRLSLSSAPVGRFPMRNRRGGVRTSSVLVRTTTPPQEKEPRRPGIAEQEKGSPTPMNRSPSRLTSEKRNDDEDRKPSNRRRSTQ